MAVTDETNANTLSGGGAMALMGGVMGSAKSKWEGSKGQEVLGSISSSIDQDTKDLISNAKSRFFNPAYIRSPTVFFGFGEQKPFFFEKGPQNLVERLRHNVTFFYLNYTIIAAILFFLTLITSRAIIGIICLGLAWASFLKATSSGSLSIGRFSISQKRATVVMTGLSGLWLFYLLSHVFWYTVSTSGFLVGLHAFFRDASMHKDEGDKVEMSGELGDVGDDVEMGDLGEDSAFLNPVDLDKSDEN